MKMFRMTSSVLAAAGMILVAQRASANEITAAAGYYIPAADEDYDLGFGAEVQYRIWLGQSWGVAIAAGISDWIANDQYVYSSALINGMQSDYYGNVSGSVYMIPLGGSLVFRQKINEQLMLCEEAGIRYVLVESDVELDGYLGTPGVEGQPRLHEPLDIDNGMIGRLKVAMECPVSAAMNAVIGIGYQFDIMKGDVALFGEQTGDNELKALFIEAGIAVRL